MRPPLEGPLQREKAIAQGVALQCEGIRSGKMDAFRTDSGSTVKFPLDHMTTCADNASGSAAEHAQGGCMWGACIAAVRCMHSPCILLPIIISSPRAASGCQNQPSANVAVLLPLLSSSRLCGRRAHFCDALSGIRPHLPAPTRHRVPILQRVEPSEPSLLACWHQADE